MAMYNEITVTAELTNTEYMITKNYNLLENKPQINSVELIGNKSLEDLGINPDAEPNVIDVVKVNGSALTPDANKAVNVTVTTGSDNGTVKVNGSDVAVKGLKSAAFTEATAYDAAGSAAEVQNNLDNLTVVVNGKVDKVQGKGLSQNDFTNAYKNKLDGIEAGAQVNAVTSVAGKMGAVTLQKSDVGLGNVDNTSDLNKPISTATQTALDGKVDKVEGKGLSTEDFTAEEKTKLAGIEDGAEVNVQADWNQTDVNADDYIKNKPEIGDAAYAEHLALTTPINNNAPYLFRAFPVRNAFKENLKSIVGASVVWNQLVSPSYYQASGSGTKYSYTSNGDGSVTLTVTENITSTTDVLLTANQSGKYIKLVIGHIYYYDLEVNSDYIYLRDGYVGATYNKSNKVFLRSVGTNMILGISLRNGLQAGTYTLKPHIHDLYAMFGSTIADYVYSLEQNQAGSGIAWLQKYGFFTKDYYAYSANTMQSVNVSAHNTVGFNQWDEEWELGSIDNTTGLPVAGSNMIRSKNYIPVLPNTRYYMTKGTGYRFAYDANKNYIGTINLTNPLPSNCHFIKFRLTSAYGTTYKNDICINLHWDGSRDGEYESYEKRSYPLDSDLELRGIPKLDANNNLYYDGDTYESDGTVTRKYGYRAYQSGDESLADAITDGTNTVYKLTTPTTETADTFQNLQIVDNFGTEEFADSRDVPIPVGNDTDFTQEIHIASLPTADGTYNATLTMSNGIATMSFVSTS